MPHHIVDIPAASRRAQAGDPQALSRAVWKHVALAEEQGLNPVVELYSHKSKTSKRLSKLWDRAGDLVGDTLDGIYLMRINLLKHSPQSVIALTPQVILGLPLFLAWNRQGQVLSPRELGGFDDSELELPLSAFFEDVAGGRPFRLAAPPLQTTPGVSPSETNDAPAANAASEENQPPPERAAAVPAVATPAVADPAAPVLASLGPANLAEAVESRSTKPNPHLAALGPQLDDYIRRATEVAVEYLTENGLLFDRTLESLVDLDVHLMEHKLFESTSDLGKRHVQKYVGPLAVYFGETLCAVADGAWYVDPSQTSVTEGLRLRVVRSQLIRRLSDTPGATEKDAGPERGPSNDGGVLVEGAEIVEDIAPAQVVLDVLEYPTHNLLGSAIQLCGLLD